MFQPRHAVFDDQQRIAALRELSSRTDDTVLCIRLRQIANQLEKRNRPLPKD
jgi:hypothetical protein